MAYTQNMLSAINSVIQSLGTKPVNSVDSGHPHVAIAKRILNEELTQMQTMGYWFNEQVGRDFQIDVDGYVYLPDDIIEVEMDNDKYIRRGNRLYDNEEFTYVFEDDVTLTVLVEIGIEDLPPRAYNYLVAKAKSIFFDDLDGSQFKSMKYDRSARLAKAKLTQQDLKMRKPTKYSTKYANRLITNLPQT